MRQVVWSGDAPRDFAAAIGRIAKDNRRAASLVADRLDAAVKLLARQPVGHPGRVNGTYERRVLDTPCIFGYVLSDGMPTILRVVHNRYDGMTKRGRKSEQAAGTA